MVKLIDIPFSLDAGALMEKYRVRPGSEHAKVFAELVARVGETGSPKALYEVAYIDEKGDDSIVVAGVTLTSRALRRNVDQVERLFPHVATCGGEVDAIDVARDDIRAKASLYMLKGELLQAAVSYVQDHISRQFHVSGLAGMNPGSGDATVWPLAQQKELFALLGDVESQIGVRLTESWLLIPEMSVSGVFFPAEADFQSCQVCHRERCPGRRAPYSAEVWEALCRE